MEWDTSLVFDGIVGRPSLPAGPRNQEIRVMVMHFLKTHGSYIQGGFDERTGEPAGAELGGGLSRRNVYYNLLMHVPFSDWKQLYTALGITHQAGGPGGAVLHLNVAVGQRGFRAGGTWEAKLTSLFRSKMGVKKSLYDEYRAAQGKKSPAPAYSSPQIDNDFAEVLGRTVDEGLGSQTFLAQADPRLKQDLEAFTKTTQELSGLVHPERIPVQNSKRSAAAV